MRGAAGLGSALQRADFLGELVARDLDEGRQPALLFQAYAAELDYADELLAGGEHDQAAASFLQAARLAFHRAAHMDSVQSPLAQDPAGFVAPLQQSQVFRRLTEQAGRRQRSPDPHRVGGRRVRVVLATMDNAHFLSEIRAQLERSEHFEVRVVDQKQYSRRFWVNPTAMLASELRHGASAAKRKTPSGRSSTGRTWCWWTGAPPWLTLSRSSTLEVRG